MNVTEQSERLSQNVGHHLVAFRNAQGLTQQALSRLCSIPRSTLAHIETGAANPTLDVLVRLCDALQVSFEELMAPPQAECRVYGPSDLQSFSQASGRATLTRLLPYPSGGLEIDRFELQAGAHFKGSPHAPSTHEFMYTERGEIQLAVAGEVFTVAAGSVAAFPGDRPHSYLNRGRSRAVALSVVAVRRG